MLDRIDSQKSLKVVDDLRNMLLRTDSDASLSVDDLKSERRRRRRQRGEQELDKRINKSITSRRKPLLQRGSSSTTLMNSSLMLDCSSTSSYTRGSLASTPEKRVSFSTAEYREYKVTVAVQSYLSYPMTLDWEYVKSHRVNLAQREDAVPRSREMKALNVRKRQQRLLAMGIPKSTLVALDRKRRIQVAGEWAFGNNAQNRPEYASGKILQYSIF